jgi:hypothetical protein
MKALGLSGAAQLVSTNYVTFRNDMKENGYKDASFGNKKA